jgi:hypothetical protein
VRQIGRFGDLAAAVVLHAVAPPGPPRPHGPGRRERLVF